MDFIQDWELIDNKLTILTWRTLSEVELSPQDLQTLTLTSKKTDWIDSNYFRLLGDVEGEHI